MYFGGGMAKTYLYWNSPLAQMKNFTQVASKTLLETES